MADAYSTALDTPLTESAATGLLANDLGTGLAAVAATLTGTQGGTLVLAADGGFAYTPETGDTGVTDIFDYTIVDADNEPSQGTASFGIA